jgi:hypothetical protein
MGFWCFFWHPFCWARATMGKTTWQKKVTEDICCQVTHILQNLPNWSHLIWMWVKMEDH